MIGAHAHPENEAQAHEQFAPLRSAMLRSLDPETLARLPGNEALDALSDALGKAARKAGIALPIGAEAAFAREIYDEIVGLGRLEPLMRREDVCEIMVNGLTQCFVDNGREIVACPYPFRNGDEFFALCQRIAARAGRRVDQASPLCDARLPDGSRVNIVFPPVAVEGPLLTIRKFPKRRMSLADLEANGTVDSHSAELLRLACSARANILIIGGAGSGKTTLLNALAAFARPSERIVTCEDVAELRLLHGHVLRLETRPANSENAGEVPMRALVRNALRMRPDRIIVGEVRGAEAADLLHAMNTGHDGSMGTLHANGPEDAIVRLQALVASGSANMPFQAVAGLVASAVDLIVHVERSANGRRRVRRIMELECGADGIRLREPGWGGKLSVKAKAHGTWAGLRALLRRRRP